MAVAVLSILVTIEGEYLETSAPRCFHVRLTRAASNATFMEIFSLCAIVRGDTGAEISQTAIDGL